MFSGATPSEYDDIVSKTTDENLTSENWELILNLCDKVQEEGQTGARAAIAAISKRLAHRNPNVQLYALSLAEALSKNLDIVVHREIASRSFTQGIEKLIIDRNTHEKVRRRALGLVATWTAEFENDTTLGIMEDCYNSLKAKNYKFEQPSEPAPPTVDDEIRRKEEEELQRVLEMSMQDRGGRSQWSQYSHAPGTSSSTAQGSGPSDFNKSSTAAVSSSTPSASHPFAQPKYPGGGYVPAPSPVAEAPQPQPQHYQQSQVQPQRPQVQTQPQPHLRTSSTSAYSSSAAPAAAVVTTATPAITSEKGNIVTRVRALHTFEPTEAGELAFEKGDIIKVVDRGYKDWWRGQLKGRTGIFPVNYVEAMPEPTAAELAKEAEQEAAVFSQAMNIEKLLNTLRTLDPAKDNLADNEEIQELYRSSMALRPKIVKLIDKYSQKRADLVSMNETFLRARTIFDRMMEESLARHTGVYDQQQPYHPSQYPQGKPDLRGAGRPQDHQRLGRVPQSYGWNPNIFEQEYPGPATAYPGKIQTGGPSQDPAAVSVPYGKTSTPGPSGLGPQQQPQGYPDPNLPSPYDSVSAPGPSVTGIPQQQQQIPAGYVVGGQRMYTGHQPNVPYTQQGSVPYPAQQQPAQQQLIHPISQQSSQSQPIQQQPVEVQPSPLPAQPVQHLNQAQHQPTQPQLVQQQPIQVQQVPFAQRSVEPVYEQSPPIQVQPEAQPQVQAQPQAQVLATNTVSPQPQALASSTAGAHSPQAQAQQQPAGPPYIYDPKATYADPNVQAWAQYYAQGGRELAGSVYFISIPGLKDGPVPENPQRDAHQAHSQVQPRQDSANVISGHQSLEGYSASVQRQQQPYQTQSQVTNLSYATDGRHQRQEQPSQVHELQSSQYQQPQHTQDQIIPQSHPQPQSQSLQAYDYPLQNPYEQVADATGPIQSSPTKTTFSGLNRGGSLSASIGGVQGAAGPTQSSPTRSTFSGLNRRVSLSAGGMDSVTGPTQSSPTESPFSALNRGGSLSAGGVGGVQVATGPTQSSPTRSTFSGLSPGSSPSAGGIGGIQADIGNIPVSSTNDGHPNPTQSTSSATPSWVLPKKTPPATVAGGSSIRAQRDVSGSGLFGGVSLSDPPVSSGESGGP